MDREHPTAWRQLDIQFADPATAEHDAITRLGPVLHAAEATGLISAWFFIRKQPWRFRYLPADDGSGSKAQRLLQDAATSITDTGRASTWTENIYEPETHAFGGPEAMTCAHNLFHADSRNIFDYLTPPTRNNGINRRELSVLLCVAMMRGAGQDRFERGDIWAKVSDGLRPIKVNPPTDQWREFRVAVQRLTTAGTGPGTALRTQPLTFADEWLSAFEEVGQDLKAVWRAGRLTRGVRAVIAHHVIFHWNRIGLTYTTQANLALAAKQCAFDHPDGTHTEPDLPTRRDRAAWASSTTGT